MRRATVGAMFVQSQGDFLPRPAAWGDYEEETAGGEGVAEAG